MTRFSTLVGASVVLLGCQGEPFKDPPIHLNQNMDFQKRFEAQEKNDFFGDKRAMRPEIEGTVARGQLRIDDHLYVGKVGEDHVSTLPTTRTDGQPLEVDRDYLEHGQERYNIYCSPCHDASGMGQGLVVQRGMLQPPSLHEEYLLAKNVGYFYDVITNGVRNMPAYAAQIPVDDRWAIAAYVRVLQRRMNASLDQVPADKAAAQGWNKQ